jgi:glucose-6-phosphate-specific signal transduction histidine kinase
MFFVNKVCNEFYSKKFFMLLMLCIVVDTVFLILKHNYWKINYFQTLKLSMKSMTSHVCVCVLGGGVWFIRL